MLIQIWGHICQCVLHPWPGLLISLGQRRPRKFPAPLPPTGRVIRVQAQGPAIASLPPTEGGEQAPSSGVPAQAHPRGELAL